MQKINVMLQEIETQDVLLFDFEEPLMINLNNKNSQAEIKQVFAHLLYLLIGDDVEIMLEIQEGYTRGLFIDVAKEYISDLNRELKETRKRIVSELGVEIEAEQV